ncbi:MAG TPA: hypothetical protein VG755_42480, partial [Nannocystaceae bacterium]|nr:hypothetical protein [Nannocystaceae bacterium]
AVQRGLGLVDDGTTLAAELRFTLARALWEQPAERPRAEQSAQQAADALSPADARTTKLRAAIEAWRRDHKASDSSRPPTHRP